jgi:predicted lipoprotein with Yx(FWY)xxD motif
MVHVLAALLAPTVVCSAATITVAEGAPVQVQMTAEGPVFANSAGLTLYTWYLDKGTPGKSTCTSTRYTTQNGRLMGIFPLPALATRKTCADKWPPFVATADAKPAGDWTLIVRADSARQWAYQGRPLYTSVKDHKPGDVNAISISERSRTGWFPAMAPTNFPPGFKLIRREAGLVLATADGKTAYVRHGARLQRTCTGCAESLQPIAAPGFGHVEGVWSIVDAAGGLKQYAFKGELLYVLPDGLEEADLERGWAPAVYRPAAATPPQFSTRVTIMGKIYTTPEGMAVYGFSCAEDDSPDRLSCDDPGDAAVYWSALCGEPAECSRRWRPYRAAPNARPVGEWTIVEVPDPIFLDPAGATYPAGASRVTAWAYRGKPLYTFVDDDEPGQILGHGINYYARSFFHVIEVPGNPN